MMDRFAQLMGIIMIILIIYVAIVAEPPLAEAAIRTFWPEQIDRMAIVTLVGGTVGGYITFAGGHRLLDAGIQGKSALPQITMSAISGIGLAAIIRIFLFLAALGVLNQGFALDSENPPASVFRLAAGKIGYILFGVVMFAAAITSVVGSAYTSVSFVKSFHPTLFKYQNILVIGFILISTAIFISIGRPVKLLVLAGALNGLILPITLATILLAAYHKKIIGDYKHPLWLSIFGWLIVLLMAYMGGYTLINQLGTLWESS
jgi:Mn2+/Fe2+ NRAMP family transporter